MSISSNDFCPTCDENCDESLPVFLCDSTCIEVNSGQVGYMYLTKVGNPLADATGSDMPTRIDNANDTDDDAIRAMCVKGQLNEPTINEEEIECGIKYRNAAEYTLTLESNNTNDLNYEAVRKLQKCQGKYLLWFSMCDGKHLYGGQDGIEVSLYPVVSSTDDTKNSRLTISYEISWDAQCMPPRILHPAAGVGC